jgi:hypothetical protein
MQAAENRYVIPGVALAGAGLIAVSSLATQVDVHVVSATAVRLVDASDSIANIPENLFNDIASVPYNEVAALNEMSADLDYTNNWFLYDPTNVLGIDEADPGKAEAIADLLVPFPAFSHYDYPIGEVPPTSLVEGLAPADQSLGYDLATIAEAELPMNAGCTGLPGPCADPDAILSHMFTAPLNELFSTTGYTFPTAVDPVDGTTLPWSDQTVSLDATAPFENFYNSLLVDPSTNPIETLTSSDITTALTNFGEALYLDYNPFAQGSYIYDPAASGLAFLTLPLSPILCPTAACDLDPLAGAYPVPNPLSIAGLPLSLSQPSLAVEQDLWDVRNLVAEAVGQQAAPLPPELDPPAGSGSSFDLLGSIFGDPGQQAATAVTPLTDLSQLTSALSGADLGGSLNAEALDPTLFADLSQFFDASQLVDVAQTALSALIP